MTGVWTIATLALAALALGQWLVARRRLERVARAGHELRAPLCAARLAAHAAARDAGWIALAPVDRELERAALALEDLEAARAGRRVAERRDRVDVLGLLDDVCRGWAPLAWPVGRDLRVERGAPVPAVAGDARRLAQAVGNLVANALEHGDGPIVLRARAARGGVRIEVDDAGDGLRAPLGRLTRRRRSGRGARGRGLAIAATVARRHGGRLRHEPLAGGCRLVLELPLADPAAAGRPEPALTGLRWGATVRPSARDLRTLR
ncbi:MAG TPA: HAMP domain-containing sensor histidine kinase [Capillimicrobium sp.]|nr:HAMP domain-containing sensor histidine kinase [Capillimicrobium sp.]